MSEKQQNKKQLGQRMMGGGRFAGMPGDKPKNFKKSLGKLVKFCKPYWPMIITAFILSFGAAFTQIFGPDVISRMVEAITYPLKIFQEGLEAIVGADNVTAIMDALKGATEMTQEQIFAVISGIIGPENEKTIEFGVFMQQPLESIDMALVLELGLFAIGLYVVGALANFLSGFIMAGTTQKVAKTLRGRISKKINRLPFAYFDKTTYGQVLSTITNDVDTIAQTLNQSTASLISAVTVLVGAIIMMFIKSWILALIAIGTSLIGFVLMGVIMKKSQTQFIKQQQNLAEMNGYVEENFSSLLVVKAFNAEEKSQEEFKEFNEKLYKSTKWSQFLSGIMQPLMMFIGNFGFVATCIVGAVLAYNGMMDFAVIVAFMIYVRIFMQPLGTLAQAGTQLQSTAAASERVFNFLEAEELSDETFKVKTLENIKGAVEFKNVKFGYIKDKTIIKDFSLTVKAGQKVAIVGQTGAGKTTLINLLMRFYELDGGEILVDGINTKDVKREEVCKAFGMVLQDTWLFNGTVKENIVYNLENITDEQVEEVCRAANIHHLIKSLPNGYNTVLDDNTAISAGQKQLFTIARAMLQNSPMLILDEATSSVDTRTEILIQEAMDKLAAGRTSFVIAHRLSTIKNADIILVLKDGDIVEQGSHKELLAKNGTYAELYNSQFAE